MVQKAENTLICCKVLLDIGKYEDSLNRAYYTIFSSLRAVLALDVVEFKKHSAVISYFNMEYIKTQKFDKKYAKIVKKASVLRNRSDYDGFFIAYKDDAEEQYNNAKEFLEATKSYIEKRIKEIEVQEDDI